MFQAVCLHSKQSIMWGGKMDSIQIVKAIIVQLDKIQVSGITNHILIHDIYNLLKALRENLEERTARTETNET